MNGRRVRFVADYMLNDGQTIKAGARGRVLAFVACERSHATHLTAVIEMESGTMSFCSTTYSKDAAGRIVPNFSTRDEEMPAGLMLPMPFTGSPYDRIRLEKE